MQEIQRRQGRSIDLQDAFLLRNIGFRSLDFAELAVKVEAKIGREINFEASLLRGIQDVGGVLDFFEEVTDGS